MVSTALDTELSPGNVTAPAASTGPLRQPQQAVGKRRKLRSPGSPHVQSRLLHKWIWKEQDGPGGTVPSKSVLNLPFPVDRMDVESYSFNAQ